MLLSVMTLNPFHAIGISLDPLKTSEKQSFPMFSGVQKEDSGIKWVKDYKKRKKNKSAKVKKQNIIS